MKKRLKNSNALSKYSVFHNCCFFIFLFIIFCGCTSKNKITQTDYSYQFVPAREWALDNQLETLSDEQIFLPEIETTIDPNTGEKTASLTIEDVLARTLANSPEITVVSFEPMLAQQEITKASSEFDVTAFGQVSYQQDDNPTNSIYQAGQSDDRMLQSGIRQKNIYGSQWSLSYAVNRNWDDLSGRTFSTRYEPILGFELKQPLLKDGWEQFNLAGIDIAEINYRISLAGFRGQAQETALTVITNYWQLYQAREHYLIIEELLNKTIETLTKVQDRREIDATDLQIKQTETYVKTRQAALLQAEKSIHDLQDQIVRLVAEPQLNILEDFNIIPATEPAFTIDQPQLQEILTTAIENNPVLQQARLDIEIADINIRIAKNQTLPRLDLVASARTQSLEDNLEAAQKKLPSGDYFSYGLGLSLEYPLGNRQSNAEELQRKIERRKAVASLQNLTERLTVLIKEILRRLETNYEEIQIQQQAVDAASTHLEVLEESELIRQELTPEFLMVKLQAQETLANAEIAHLQAVTELNIAQAELAKIMGVILQLQQVQNLQIDTSMFIE